MDGNGKVQPEDITLMLYKIARQINLFPVDEMNP